MKETNDNLARQNVYRGVEIGRRLGRIDQLLRDMAATAAVDLPLRHIAKAMRIEASKLAKDLDGLEFSAREQVMESDDHPSIKVVRGV